MEVFNPKAMQLVAKKHDVMVFQLAHQVDIPADTMMEYLDGRKIPSLEELVKIADYLDEPIDAIIGRRVKVKSVEAQAERAEEVKAQIDMYREEANDMLLRAREIEIKAKALLKILSIPATAP